MTNRDRCSRAGCAGAGAGAGGSLAGGQDDAEATPEPIEVSPFQILATSKTVHGHPSGTAKDVEEAPDHVRARPPPA
jgi:hypothetical protein